MSGGVGPTCDITLPKEEPPHQPDEVSAIKPPARRTFFTFRQLNALAVAIVLSASGMVSAEEFAFVIFSVAYIYFISKVAFPPASPSPTPGLRREKHDSKPVRGGGSGDRAVSPHSIHFRGHTGGGQRGD
ncbi:hypothetical protein Sango_0729000 [Sesamum angolense]|uniref:DUF7733 domain-containing protein n=1 Tax=Sesamum angolense TaxID=2727404 RepID=A0AAE1X2R5_9LAMI|nr:hypothetical protein Sango_0729000 [Sesamum angolense]